MAVGDTVQRVRVYIRERDRWEGQPLHLALLARLLREGATGATALRGLAGFGPGQRLRATSVADMTEQPPVVIEWIDRAERVARLLPLLDDILSTALVTVEEVGIYRAALRAGGSFAVERSVGDYLAPHAETIVAATGLRAAAELLIASDQPVLPVLDERRQVSGVLASADLTVRAGLPLPIRLLRALPPAERAALLDALPEQAAEAVMTREPRCAYVGAAVPQALVTMLEWSYSALPVIDRTGAFAGLLDGWGVLRAARDAAPPEGGAVRDIDPPTPVSLIMQTAVQQAAVSQPLASVLALLVASPYVVLVDAAQRVRGLATDVDALRALSPAERDAFVAALRGQQATLPGDDRGTEGLLAGERAMLRPTDTLYDAVARLVELRAERIPVADGDDKLVGLVTRAGLLRALAQAQ
jgi:PII-like signaling protein/CBS-domain-containing membrane protein